MDEPYVYLILPYLTCRQRFRVRGLEFRNSEDRADLPGPSKEHLSTLCEMFFLQDNVRIKGYGCAALQLPQEEAERRRHSRLVYEAQGDIVKSCGWFESGGGLFDPDSVLELHTLNDFWKECSAV